VTALLAFLRLLVDAVLDALQWLGQLLVDVLAAAVDLTMPTLLAGAAMALALAVTQFPALRAIPAWGGLVVGVTTAAVVIGIVAWAHLAHGWWAR